MVASRIAAQRRRGLVLGAVAAWLVGCAAPPVQAPAPPPRELVFPSPPDEPRFVYERTVRSTIDLLPD